MMQSKLIRFVTFTFCIAFLQTANAAVKLPKLISDGMVLQRDTRIKIWGWANIHEGVKVIFNRSTYASVAGEDGKWYINTEAMKAGGPYVMEIIGENHITIKNIMLGDVWVCSGQSNMELPIERVAERYPDLIANSANPYIREFWVPNTYVFTAPQDDVTGGIWEEANPQTVPHFTAVGYFFAKELYQKYHVTIGLIKSCVGGSPAQAWLSGDALKQFPGYRAVANQYKNAAYLDSVKKAGTTIANSWNENIKLHDEGLTGSKPWFDNGYDASAWATLQLPGYWDNQGLKNTNGVVWLRKEIDVPASLAGQPAQLWLGRVIDQDFAYVNGVFVGTTGYQYPPRRYPVAAGVLKAGKNVIVVRLISNSGLGGFVPDKPYQLHVGNQIIDLQGAWQYKLGYQSKPMASSTTIAYQPVGLYNGMIAPLLNYKIKGVIWYQGESNTAIPTEYHALFTNLINDWRSKWAEGSFPFLYVQLANFMETRSQPTQSGWANVREAQLQALQLPNTGMAVITDLGDWNDVHPTNKSEVGKRLALAAQKVAYGDNKVVYSGPVYQTMKIDGDHIIISFTNTGGGLKAKGGGELKYFAIAGADKKFVWAKAKLEGNKVIVWNDAVKIPVAVRYAWADNPEGANLYNKELLPASPFRTDDW
jgi:sialate O-acetylesterase